MTKKRAGPLLLSSTAILALTIVAACASSTDSLSHLPSTIAGEEIVHTFHTGVDLVAGDPEGEAARLLRLTGRQPRDLTSVTAFMAPDATFGYFAMITRIEGVAGEALLPLVAYEMDGLEQTTIAKKTVWVRARGSVSDYFYAYDDVVIVFSVSDLWVLVDALEQLP